MLLEGKKAVVTGGTRGIGFAVVETFLKNGASVALFGSRQETVDKALAKLKAENPQSFPRIRGGDPEMMSRRNANAWFSPHPRG